MKTTKEAAEMLGISQRRVVELIGSGALKGERVGRMWLVDEAGLRKRIEHPVAAGRPKEGNLPSQTRFMLKNRTHDIAEVVYDSSRKEFTWIGGLLDSNRAPMGLAVEGGRLSLLSFNIWWRNRGIPEGRFGIEKLLSERGVSIPSELSVKSLGLSLSDQYWLKPAEADLSWEEVNFFHNDFEDARFASSVSGESIHPDNTSDGNLPKHWIIGERGVRCLLKGGAGLLQEPFNEVVATALHARIVPRGHFVPYQLAELDGGPASKCEGFVRDDEEYIPAYYVSKAFPRESHRSEYQHYVDCCYALGIEDAEAELARMIVCDDILANTDRHARNYGIVRNVETLKCRMAPIFDSGTSLWCTKSLYDLKRGDYSFEGKQFNSNPARQLLLAGDLTWLDVSLLDGFVDEAMGILSQNARIEDRLPYIREALESRVRRIVTIREALEQ